MTPPNRRGAPRIVKELPLLLGDDTQELISKTENISASGAYCTVTRFLPLMTKVRVRFEVPTDSKPVRISCGGVVVRIEPAEASPHHHEYRAAIFFNDMTDRDRTLLARYVQQHL